jgi:predicted PurR-regulated permease PerM
MSQPRSELARSTLGVLCIAVLILAVFWILRPFAGAAIWAATIVVTTWSTMLRLQSLLWGRRSLAVAAMTLAWLVLLIAPVTLAVVTIVQHVDDVVVLTGRLSSFQMPAPPDWLVTLPLVGARVGALWESVAAEGLMSELVPYARPAIEWLVQEVGSVGHLLVQSALVVALAALMYANGEAAVSGLKRVARRLAGQPGEAVLVLSGQAIRGVALGVGVTAVAQCVLGGVGLAIAGVPYAGLLTVVMFILSLAQLGPILVLLPAAAWMFWSGAAGWGVFLLLICVAAGVLDNVLRPFLIRRGADLPLLLIFAGVIGGLLAFGLVGIFIGPVVLAVAYTLMQAWTSEDAPPAVQ